MWSGYYDYMPCQLQRFVCVCVRASVCVFLSSAWHGQDLVFDLLDFILESLSQQEVL